MHYIAGRKGESEMQKWMEDRCNLDIDIIAPVSYTHLAAFLPIAVILGFRQEKLVAILVMLGSATTVSSFIMAKNMGHEGSLTANTVMLTTCGSAFTLTFWLYLMKTLAFI